ncbi:hypothetical protein Q1695_011601 [Nippostrongylus brasiliensis]|nr:hypothetical protein Q1695_011601 [Nippostrongylus brasiliensis]
MTCQIGKDQVKTIRESQEEILSRLARLESKFENMSSPSVEKSLLYSTLVKVKTDSKQIDEKATRIAWIGIDEQENEELTRRFDREILKAVQSSGDEELIREFDNGRIVSHRHPAGKPRVPGSRGRIIKICLPNQEHCLHT